MKLSAGQWVLHSQKEWGPGRVESVADYVTVCFPDYKGGAALRFPAATNPLLVLVDQVQTEATLRLQAARLPTRHSSAKSKAGSAAKGSLSADALVERFHAIFPEGFRGQQYLDEERANKLAASKACRNALDLDTLTRLIDDDDRDALIAAFRHATSKVKNLLAHAVPAAKFTQLLRREESIVAIARGFVDVFREPGKRPAVNGLYHALHMEGAPLITWPFATLLPALYDPKRHIFVQPEAFRLAIAAIGHEATLKPRPDDEGYAHALTVAEKWLTRLTPMGAIDFLDVQSFMMRSKPEAVPVVVPVAAAAADPVAADAAPAAEETPEAA